MNSQNIKYSSKATKKREMSSSTECSHKLEAINTKLMIEILRLLKLSIQNQLIILQNFKNHRKKIVLQLCLFY